MKRILFAATVLAMSGAALLPTQAVAAVDFNIVIGNAPPPVRYEMVPAPRRGYVWTPGFWAWEGKQHRWNEGHWERARAGYYYQEPQWQQVWQLTPGSWQRGERPHDRGHARNNKAQGDRDRDGIPNRVDRDRDGDGVPNRYDDKPNNPRRH